MPGVSGSAGTGKTIVALHRAVFLARKHPDAKMLLATFSKPLAKALESRLNLLAGGDAALIDRIAVASFTGLAHDLYADLFGEPNLAPTPVIRTLIEKAAAATSGHRFTTSFLLGEWSDVVDAWQLRTWEAYRDVARLGPGDGTVPRIRARDRTGDRCDHQATAVGPGARCGRRRAARRCAGAANPARATPPSGARARRRPRRDPAAFTRARGARLRPSGSAAPGAELT